MVDSKITNYLKDNLGEYNLDSLVNKLISSGYSKSEINLAVKQLGLAKEDPAQDKKDRDWMKIGAFGSLILIVYLVLSVILAFFIPQIHGVLLIINNIVYVLLTLTAIVSLFLAYIGIYHLGKYFNDREIKFAASSIIFVFLMAILLFIIFAFAIFFQRTSITGNAILTQTATLIASSPLPSVIISPLGIFLELIFLLITVYYFIAEFRLATQLIKLKNKIIFIKPAGICKLARTIVGIIFFLFICFLIFAWIFNPALILGLGIFINRFSWIFNLLETIILISFFLELFFITFTLLDGSKKRRYIKNLENLQSMASEIRKEAQEISKKPGVVHEPKSFKTLLPEFPKNLNVSKKRKFSGRKSNFTAKKSKKKS